MSMLMLVIGLYSRVNIVKHIFMLIHFSHSPRGLFNLEVKGRSRREEKLRSCPPLRQQMKKNEPNRLLAAPQYKYPQSHRFAENATSSRKQKTGRRRCKFHQRRRRDAFSASKGEDLARDSWKTRLKFNFDVFGNSGKFKSDILNVNAPFRRIAHDLSRDVRISVLLCCIRTIILQFLNLPTWTAHKNAYWRWIVKLQRIFLDLSTSDQVTLHTI